MNKICTSIEQSKKLAKILPLESADMLYYCDKSNNIQIFQYPFIRSFKEKDTFSYLHCWSLAALLNVIPKHINESNVLRIDISTNDFAMWYDEIGFGVNNDLPDSTKESAVDACYEFILQLHKLKLL